jgi:hypothetical protein
MLSPDFIMPKNHRLKPLTALGFFNFNVLRQFLTENRSVPVHCIEYALRNLADRIPVRGGGSRIQWCSLKHLISAKAEREWTLDIQDWDELGHPGFFLGFRNTTVILAQGALNYSTPLGIKERRQMEARSKLLKLLLDGCNITSPRMKAALKGLSVLTTAERKVINSGFYSLFAEVRVMEGAHFDDSDDDIDDEGDATDALIMSERKKTNLLSDDDRPYEDEPDFTELYSLHEHVLSLIIKVKSGGRRTQKLLDEINFGENEISHLGMNSYMFTREKERLSRVRNSEWEKC